MPAPESGSESGTNGTGPDEQHSTSAPPAKRQKVLACKRCRARKQRCDAADGNSCSNCKRADKECIPTEPVILRSRYKAQYVHALEQRVAQLEQLEQLGSFDSPSRVDLSGAPTQHAPSGYPDPNSFDSASMPYNHAPAGPSVNMQTEPALTFPTPFPPGNEIGQGAGTSPPAPRSNNPNPSPALTNSTCSIPTVNHQKGASPTANSALWPHDAHQYEYFSRSDSTITGLLATFIEPGDAVLHRRTTGSCASGDPQGPDSPEQYFSQKAAWPESLPATVEDHLINLYFDMANVQWPFLLKETLISWLISWRTRPRDGFSVDAWKGFFVNMIFSVSLLLDPQDTKGGKHTSQAFYKHAVGRYLPAVLSQPSQLLHVQAYLLMAIHSLFSPSTDRIPLMVSSAMRYCIVARFHLREAEPKPVDAASRLEIQLRRRAFWVAYSLDRNASGIFQLPVSVSDDVITVPLYDNVEDADLTEPPKSSHKNPYGRCSYTAVSSALHRVRCFQIQSEILSVTMRSDFSSNFDSLSNWRSYILSKLDHWKSQLREMCDANSKSYTNDRWVMIPYNHCLLYLYRPTKSNVRGPAGDWSIQASTQTASAFRKFQADHTISNPWLGLISQFSIGITILYCFWATPPRFRTESFTSTNVATGLRACSNILAIMADRWEAAKDLRDVFELLATEIPTTEMHSDRYFDNRRALKRVSNETASEIRSKLGHVKSLVVNAEVLRMIEEMITEDLPRDEDVPSEPFETGDKHDLPVSAQNLASFQFTSPWLTAETADGGLGELGSDQILEFPGSLSGYDLFS